MALRALIRDVSPPGLRLAVAGARRALRDRRNPVRFAERSDTECAHPIVKIVQPIRNTGFAAGKLGNLRLGAARIDGVVIAPGETLSFWHLVGPPTERAGFAVGRSIRDGAVGGDVGGGLCQLSGALYELGLRGGMQVVERHPHSRDLYAEEERFTPLGLDATVVWRYKDMRLATPHDVPVRIGARVDDMTLTVVLAAAAPFPAFAIDIDRVDLVDHRQVRVSRGADLISDDRYDAP